jgi:hypothetical protein
MGVSCCYVVMGDLEACMQQGIATSSLRLYGVLKS